MGQHRTDETPARTALRGSFVRAFNSGGWGLLTPREEPVVALAAQGLSNRDTAQELNLSEHPVKKYLLRILDKLGISSRAELVLCAVHHRDPRPAEWPAGHPPARARSRRLNKYWAAHALGVNLKTSPTTCINLRTKLRA